MGLDDLQILSALQEAININIEEGIAEANDFLLYAMRVVKN